MIIEKLTKKVNRENAPPDGWSAADAVKKDKPEPGKVYRAYWWSRGGAALLTVTRGRTVSLGRTK